MCSSVHVHRPRRLLHDVCLTSGRSTAGGVLLFRILSANAGAADAAQDLAASATPTVNQSIANEGLKAFNQPFRLEQASLLE